MSWDMVPRPKSRKEGRLAPEGTRLGSLAGHILAGTELSLVSTHRVLRTLT